jgi:hypothetical protein
MGKHTATQVFEQLYIEDNKIPSMIELWKDHKKNTRLKSSF